MNKENIELKISLMHFALLSIGKVLDFATIFQTQTYKNTKFFFVNGSKDVEQKINRENFRNIKRCICACCVGTFHQVINLRIPRSDPPAPVI